MFLLFFGFFVNLLLLTTPIFMMQIFDRVLSSGRLETLVFLALIAALALLVLGALEMVRARLLHRVGSWLDRQLSPKILAASVQGALAGQVTSAQGLRNVATIKGFFGGNAFLDLIWVPFFIAAVWLIHPWLGWGVAAFALVILVIAYINELATRQAIKAGNASQINAHTYAEQSLRNADVIHAMGMMAAFRRQWTGLSNSALDHHHLANDRGATLSGISRFVRLLAQIFALGLGAYFVLGGELTVGGMIAASILSARALAPVELSINAWKSFVNVRSATHRIKSLLALDGTNDNVMELPAPKGVVRVEDMSYAVPGQERPILQKVNLAIEPGELVGLVGASASGKTTLCRSLVGSISPTEGFVRLDGAEITRWPSEQIGPHIGYLPQDIKLFAGSVQANITRLDQDSDSKRILEASRLAGVHETILRLPEGYDTEIGPSGARLSGGQRQRIGLERALYGRPRLLVLDEPNSNLDREGEECLAHALLNAREWGATIIVVSHKPALINLADKIAVMKQGRLTHFGPRDELLSLIGVPSVVNQRNLRQKVNSVARLGPGANRS